MTGTAFCGAFTTYSTFSYETFRLAEDRAWLFAALNAAASISAALGAAYFGMAIAQAITMQPLPAHRLRGRAADSSPETGRSADNAINGWTACPWSCERGLC